MPVLLQWSQNPTLGYTVFFAFQISYLLSKWAIAVCSLVRCMACKYSIFQNYYATEIRHSFRSCSIGTNRVELVRVFYVFYWESTVFGWISLSTFSTQSEPSWIDWKLWVLTAITIIGSYPLCNVNDTNTIMFNMVGVWCLLSPGIWQCFQLFHPKTV